MMDQLLEEFLVYHGTVNSGSEHTAEAYRRDLGSLPLRSALLVVPLHPRAYTPEPGDLQDASLRCYTWRADRCIAS